MRPDFLLKTRRQAIARARRKHGLKDYLGALAEWNDLLSRNADDPLAMLGRFDCFMKLEMKDELLEVGEAVCEANPDSQAAHNNYACLLLERQQYQKAAQFFNKAIAMDDSRIMYYFNAGIAYRGAGQLSKAAVCFERVLEFEPEHERALEFLSQIYLEFGLADRVIDLSLRLRLQRPGYTLPLQRRLYAMFADNRISEAEKNQEVAVMRGVLGQAPEMPAKEKTVIGWIVCPWGLKTLRYLMPILHQYRDRNQIELVGFTNDVLLEGVDIDHLFDRVYRCESSVPEKMYGLLAVNPVDVLVDTAGQVPNNFSVYYAKRLAPRQISWPISHVLSELVLMDRALVDRNLLPKPDVEPVAATQGQANLLDRLHYLECGLFAYQLQSEAPEVSPLPAKETGKVTFGVVTELIRINADAIAAWSRILDQVNGSRLIIASTAFPSVTAEQHLRTQFADCGLEKDRVEFVTPPVEFDQRLALYQQFDIVLNAFPFGETLKLADAMVMGCPVLGIDDGSHLTRLSRSIMAAAGKEHWMYSNAERLVAAAVGMAGDLSTLDKIRAALRADLSASPLLQAESWAREILQGISQV